eukprot:5067318-Prymnesium_polylepis.1
MHQYLCVDNTIYSVPAPYSVNIPHDASVQFCGPLMYSLYGREDDHMSPRAQKLVQTTLRMHPNYFATRMKPNALHPIARIITKSNVKHSKPSKKKRSM